MRQTALERISQEFDDCITDSCYEHGCRLRLDGIAARDLAIIDGSQYQAKYNYHERLSDRIVFCGSRNLSVAIVELKGGSSIHMTRAITQIKNGLEVAGQILDGANISSWVPLLLYSGGLNSTELKLLRTTLVTFRGSRKLIVKRDCGTQLSSVIDA